MSENVAPEIKEEIPETPTLIDDVPAEDPRDAQIWQLEQDMDLLRQENQQLRCCKEQQRQQLCRQSRHIKTMEIVHGKQLSEADEEIAKARAQANQTQPIKWPSILFGLFFVLAILVELCVIKSWMVSLLGEILFCGFTAGCAFFGGVLWSRTAAKRVPAP